MSNLIKATEYFASRRSMNELFDGELSSEEITRIAEASVTNIYDWLYDTSPGIDGYLPDETLRLGVSLVERDIEEIVASNISLLDSHQVYNTQEGYILPISKELLAGITGLAQPYLEEVNHHQGLALAVAVNIGVAGWLFDKLDPRLNDNIGESTNIRNAAIEAGLEGLRHDDEDVDSVMDILRYRFIGYLGFSELLKDPKFQTVQHIFSAYFDQANPNQQIALEDNSFSLKFAFAHMLSKGEAETTVLRLVRINDVIEKYTK